jgi:predicted outer membrane repeat protein
MVRGRLNPIMVVMLLLLAVLYCQDLAAQILYFDADAPGVQTGVNWANAFTDPQDALAAFSIGDQILVAEGVYKPAAASAARTSTFQMPDGVAMFGGYAGFGEADPNRRDISAYQTILSGDLNGNDAEISNLANLVTDATRSDNCYHVITAADANVVLDGFTISGGNAGGATSEHKTGGAITFYTTGSATLNISRCTFEADSAFERGGAIRCEGQAIIKDCGFTGNYAYKGACFEGKGSVTACLFEKNVAYGGGAIYAYNTDTDLILKNCTFDDNTANYGGAIDCYLNTITISKCSFAGNRAISPPGGGDGGAIISRWTSSPVITDCTFTGNTAADQGGAIYSHAQTTNAQFANCVFEDNSANYGGALYNEAITAGNLTIKNCLFTGNYAKWCGGAIEDAGSPTIRNCTIANNTADLISGLCGGLFNSAGVPVIIDSIFWANMDRIGGYQSAQIGSETTPPTIDISYSNVQAWEGDLGGTDNLGSDPRFVTGEPGPYCLRQVPPQQAPNSPCFDRGSNTAANLGMDAYSTRTDRIRDSGQVDRGFHWPVQWTWHVNVNGGSDSNTGRTAEDAFETIQKGINTAVKGDTVLIYPGDYLEPDPGTPETIEISGKNITIRSIDPYDANIVENTVIRGVVQFGGAESPDCLLQGLTISDLYHGAVYGNHTQATLSHCILQGNGPCAGTVLEDWDGLITNCLIADNDKYWSCGYGATIYGCRGRMQNCTVANNYRGIGVALGDTFTVENCIIYGNVGAQFSVQSGATLNISFSDIAGGFDDIINEDGTINWSLGNIDTDPCFVRLGSFMGVKGDYSLLPYSNCIEAASNALSLHESTDVAGEPRIADAVADMGCFEFQGILHVDPSGSGLYGLKWSDAFGNLQDALTMAIGAPRIKEIRVAQGTYRPAPPAGDKTTSFAMADGVMLKGGYAGIGAPDADLRNVGLYESVLSGDLNSDDGPNFTNTSDNSYHVVTSVGTADSAVLDGFTVTGGDANGAAPQNLDKGGGIYASSSSASINNCRFETNHAVSGGAAFFSGSAPAAANCLFAGNAADSNGGAIYDISSALSLVNCTISANTAGAHGGGIYSDTSDNVTNCILWANTDSGGSDESAQVHSTSSAQIDYSCIQGLTAVLGGLGNVADDPLFADAASGDYHLKSQGWRWDATQQNWVSDAQTSPCIDRGNPGMSLANEPLTVPADPDNQSGENVRLNMGMYGRTAEASMGPPGWVLLSDINNDGTINALDYAFQAEIWLENTKNLPGDLDRDGSVDTLDLALLASQWLNTDSQSQ